MQFHCYALSRTIRSILVTAHAVGRCRTRQIGWDDLLATLQHPACAFPTGQGRRHLTDGYGLHLIIQIEAATLIILTAYRNPRAA